jgi:hypothetical protein
VALKNRLSGFKACTAQVMDLSVVRWVETFRKTVLPPSSWMFGFGSGGSIQVGGRAGFFETSEIKHRNLR